jgi:hypothetical protein
LSEEDCAYLKRMPFTITFPHLDTIVVHAGLVPNKPLAAQSLASMYRMRNLFSVATPQPQDGVKNIDDSNERHDLSLLESEHTDEGVAWASLWSKHWRTELMVDILPTQLMHEKRDTRWRVVFGHDAVRKLQLYERAFGLDTGCCYGFSLTALILPTEQIVQVKAKQQYSKPKLQD